MCLPKEPVDNGTERYQDEQMVRADDGPTLVSLAEPFLFFCWKCVSGGSAIS
jgi:hypothetical protein